MTNLGNTGPAAAEEAQPEERRAEVAQQGDEHQRASSGTGPSRPRILPPPPGPFFTRERSKGLLLVGLSFFAAIGISWKSKVDSTPEFTSPPGEPTTQGIAGFPKNVLLVPNVPEARRQTPRTELTGVTITRARAIGVDVTAGGTVVFRFRSRAGEGPQAERPYGQLARKLYCGTQRVVIDEKGLGANTDRPNASCHVAAAVVPDPTCKLQALFDGARAGGLPDDAVVQIEYFLAQHGPAYRITPDGGAASLVLGADCRSLLDETQARPAVANADN